jgi:hypothetical protein
MSRLGGSIFGCGVRRLAPFEWIGNCGPSRAGSNKVWKWNRHPPAGSPGDTVSAGSETDKTRAQKHVADARSDTQESGTVTWPTTNEPRSDALQLEHEREQRRRSETLNPGPARGQDTAESTGVTCKRQTNMRQMAEHLRLKPGSQKTPTVAHDRRHGRTQRATTAATAAPDSAPKTAPARQKRGATGHRSRAQRAAQTTPPTGKSSPRRSTRSMADDAHRTPKAATSTNWRQPAYEAPEGPKSLEKASDQSNTGGSWQQTAGGRGFAGAQNPGKSR